MPVQVKHLEDRIFLLDWQGDITVQDVHDSHNETARISKEKKYKSYIHVIDGKDLEKYPLDLHAFWKILIMHPQVFALCTVNMPAPAVMLSRMLNAVSKQITLKDYATIDDALADARIMLSSRRA